MIIRSRKAGRMKRLKIEPQLCFLLVCFVVLHIVYVQAVIPPQIGWWNYYAWRVNSGEILYKDILGIIWNLDNFILLD